MSLESAAPLESANSLSQGLHDVQVMSAMRLTLAGSALLITWFDHSKPEPFLPLISTTLLLYTLYSLVIYVPSVRSTRLVPIRFLHLIDFACAVILIYISG